MPGNSVVKIVIQLGILSWNMDQRKKADKQWSLPILQAY